MHAKSIGLALALACATLTSMPSRAKSCFEDIAQTRSYSLGMAVHATPTPDGSAILYLRSGPRDISQRLYEYTIATKSERELVTPESLLGGKTESLTPEEKARRERARVSVRGFTDFELSRDGSRVLAPLDGKLYVVDRASGAVTPLPGSEWIGPKLSPDGTMVAAIHDEELHVIDIARGTEHAVTTGATAALTHGVAEFVAQEEMGRSSGFWWSPDSKSLAYEEADLSGVETRYIANPLNPNEKPAAFRYPSAGSPNAKVRLGVISVDGGATSWAKWDANAYPYLARVEWSKNAPLTILVQNRPQTGEKILAVDAHGGATRLLWTEKDSAFIELPPSVRTGSKEVPFWLSDGSGFLWASERGGLWQLELHNADGSLKNAITPAGFRFHELLDVDEADGGVVVSGGTSRLSQLLYRIKLSGGAPMALADRPGLHDANFGEQHAIFAHHYSLADGTAGVDVRAHDGRAIAALPSVAEAPPSIPRLAHFTVGALGMDAQVLFPKDFNKGRKYPVILAVYAGPAAKLVWAAPRMDFEDQCMADHGYIVATIDGRGTPGRDRAWLRAIKGNAIDIPLQDQVDGLHALAAKVPQMDLARVGVTGWSFGGYFTVMATLRRPDVFAAGVAGAPVTDWKNYDTYYTERYMGTPQANPEGYRISRAMTYADQLRRPLLLVHGVTDDNVYFQHTLELAEALLIAGKKYELLLLPGTHMLSDAALHAREMERLMGFFGEHLKPDAKPHA
ncbi:MAG TPA: DPP IV N-terminal domain-containing protein [Rhizomicrobium sp.]|jgi:dipeptidyl-peptidase-4